MHRSRPRARRLAIAATLVMTAAVLIPVAAVAAPSSKGQITTATTSVHGGTTSAIEVKIKNTSSSGNITAEGLRIYLDPDIDPANVQSVSAPAPGTVTPIASTLVAPTPYVEILGASIARNRTYTVTLNTRIPCGTAGTVYDWVTDVRQSNDFSGTGNELPPEGALAKTTVVSTCALAFTTQPTNAASGATITGTAYDPAGPAVAVAVKSGGSSPSTVTWYSGSVAVATSPVTGLGGTTPKTVVNGVASFGDLSIAAGGTYTLGASATGATGATSNAFVIGFGATVDCALGGSPVCTTGNFPGPGGSVGNVTVNDNDTIEATLSAAFVANDINCDGYEEFGDNLYFDIDVTEGSLAGLTKTVTITKPIPAGRPAVTGVDEWRYQACFQSRAQFQAVAYSDSAQASFDNLLKAMSNGDWTDAAEVVPVGDRVLGDKSADEYRGLLPYCALVADASPCLNSVTFNGGGTVTFVGTVPAADPQWK